MTWLGWAAVGLFLFWPLLGLFLVLKASFED